MRLRVRHRTEYRYSAPITDSVNELRLTPPTTRFQTRESSLLSVLPACRLRHYDDLNVNRVHVFEIPEPFRRVFGRIEAYLVENRNHETIRPQDRTARQQHP